MLEAHEEVEDARGGSKVCREALHSIGRDVVGSEDRGYRMGDPDGIDFDHVSSLVQSRVVGFSSC